MAGKARQKSYQKGHWAESFAALYFLSKGYSVLHRRYKTRLGEIDLVLKKRNMLVFVEVKARKNLDDALNSIHAQNRERIENASLQFLADYPSYNSFDMRLDAFCIAVNKGVFPIKFVHLDNAWLSGS